ncbi:MAG: hypothetical protein K2X27_17385 [Candidatus Obscuribacterales bacterium]|nr:hypothetical protein [Candidatus Obscuribacterales bacterium]
MTMNCSRFRFLLQQRVDIALAPQDERMVSQHVDSCDSCGRFLSQIEQVCHAAAEVPLPEECLPASMEALAGSILQTMPQEKKDFFSTIKNVFGGGSKKEPAMGKPPGKAAASSKGGGFPHVSRSQPAAELPSEAPPVRGKRVEQVDELMATSTRLKSLSKIQPPSDAEQSTTQGVSLAKKMGVDLPSREAPKEEGPLNLAETIRRNVAAEKPQEQAPAAGWGAQSNSGQNNPAFEAAQSGWGAQAGNFNPADAQAAGWGAPPQAPSPVQDSGWGAPPQAPGPAQDSAWGAPSQPQIPALD